MSKTSVYIPIDDVQVTKPTEKGQPTIIDFPSDTPVYERTTSGYVQTGRTTRRGIRSAPAPQQTYHSELLQQTYSSSLERDSAEQAFRRRQIIEQQRQQEVQRAAEQQRQMIIIQASGGIKIQDPSTRKWTTHFGESEIPRTGMTANEYRRYIQQQAIERGDVKKGEEGRYDYTITFSREKDVKEKTITVPYKGDIVQTIVGGTLPDLSLPNFYIGEGYDSRSGMFISPSITGTGATGILRPSSPEETRVMKEIDKIGSFEFLFSKVTGGVTKVMEYGPIKATTTYVRDIPLIQDESILTDTFGLKPTTVGEGLLFTKEKSKQAGEFLQAQYEDISFRLFEKAETKKGRTKEWLELAGYTAKGVGYVGKVIPKIIEYKTFGLIGTSSTDILATEEKIAKPEKYVQDILDVGYKEYGISYEKAKQDLPEGYELEPFPTRIEFDKKFEGEARQDVISGFRREQVVPFALLGSGVGIGAYKFITKPTITAGQDTLYVSTRWRERLGLESKYRIRFQDVVSSKGGISPKFIISGKPTAVLEKGKLQVELYKDIYGFKRVSQVGRKTIVEQPSLFSNKVKTLFSGESFTKVGKLQKADVVERFKSLGISSDWTKESLRLYQPTILDMKFRGDLLKISRDGKQVGIIKGVTTQKYQPDIIQGIKTRIPSGQVERITVIGTPVDIMPKIITHKTGRIVFRHTLKLTTKETPFQFGLIKRESVGLTPSAIQKGKVTTYDKFVSITDKSGIERLPSIAFRTKDYSMIDLAKTKQKLIPFGKPSKETGRLLITKETDKFFPTPTKRFVETDVYETISKTRDTLVKSKVFVRTGVSPYEPPIKSGVKIPKLKSKVFVTGEVITETKTIGKSISASNIFATTKELTFQKVGVPTITTTQTLTPTIISTGLVTEQLRDTTIKQARDTIPIFDVVVDKDKKFKQDDIQISILRLSTEQKTSTRQITSPVVIPIREIIPSPSLPQPTIPEPFIKPQSHSFKLSKPTVQTKTPVPFLFKLPKPTTMKQPRGIFEVLGRRFGKFKLIGIGKTEREAFAFGKDWTSKTLGVTFKVPKARARQLPGFKTKITKEGKVLYIEPRGKRLKKRGTEVQEIQFFRELKGGKKKK